MVLDDDVTQLRDRDRVDLPGPPQNLLPTREQLSARISRSSQMLEALARQRGELLTGGPTVRGAPPQPARRPPQLGFALGLAAASGSVINSDIFVGGILADCFCWRPDRSSEFADSTATNSAGTGRLSKRRAGNIAGGC